MKLHFKISVICHVGRGGGGRGEEFSSILCSIKIASIRQIFFQYFLHSTGDFSHLTFNYLQSMTFLAKRLWFVNHIIFMSSFNLSFG